MVKCAFFFNRFLNILFLSSNILLLLHFCRLPLQDDVVEDSMVVDVRHHRHFVCRRGQVLRELAEEYGGVAVSFPRTGANSQRVTLKGAKDCVEAAKKRIQEIIEDLVYLTNSESNMCHKKMCFC